ncbi:hypothetical protein M569_15686 [Genlisea aurea]|uniref:PUM-HD domain-containing protein n=1 Tax=Genlisea aurea TaxID=192259 RepID=S8BWX9_9LAMI|nr:hypothetical protein M569_15686 [Genlisea aurea]
MDNPTGGFPESPLSAAETGGGYFSAGDSSVQVSDNVNNDDSQLDGLDSNNRNLGISGGSELPFFMEPPMDYFYPFAGTGNSVSRYEIDGLDSNFGNLAISGEPLFRAFPSEYSNPTGNSYLQNITWTAARDPFSGEPQRHPEFTASTSGYSDPAGNSYLLSTMRAAARHSFSGDFSGRLWGSYVPTPMNPSPEFRSESTFEFQTDDIFGSDFSQRIPDIVRDKEGCELIQRILEQRNPVHNQAIFNRIKPHIPGLMIDPYGICFIQKCCQVFDHNQFTELLFILIHSETLLKNICNDVHGTRAVQKMVEYMITPRQRANFVYALRRIVSDIARNPHGNHVIDQCFKLFSTAELTHIVKAIADHFLPIAMNRSGCRLVQRCYLRADDRMLRRLLAETASSAFILSQHEYGYVANLAM